MSWWWSPNKPGGICLVFSFFLKRIKARQWFIRTISLRIMHHLKFWFVSSPSSKRGKKIKIINIVSLINIQYTTSTVKRKNGDNRIILFFFTVTFLYKCIQSLRMRNWGIDLTRGAPMPPGGSQVRGQEVTRLHLSPVRFVRARTGGGVLVHDRKKCVCVCLSLSRWKPQRMTWNILHRPPSVQSAQQQEAFTHWRDDLDPLLSQSHFSFPILCLLFIFECVNFFVSTV